jgi:hypothetical protein
MQVIKNLFTKHHILQYLIVISFSEKKTALATPKHTPNMYFFKYITSVLYKSIKIQTVQFVSSVVSLQFEFHFTTIFLQTMRENMQPNQSLFPITAFIRRRCFFTEFYNLFINFVLIFFPSGPLTHHTFVVLMTCYFPLKVPSHSPPVMITLLPSLRTSECLNTCTIVHICLNCQFTDYSLGRRLYCEYAAFSTNNTSLWSGSASLL